MHASQQYLQAAVRTFVVDPDILSKFSNIENLIFFRRSVRCQHQLKLYSIECDGQFLKKRKKLEIIPGALLKEVKVIKKIITFDSDNYLNM